MRHLAVLISGSGTNLQAIIDSCGTLLADTRVSVVVSNRRVAYGLVRAQQFRWNEYYRKLIAVYNSLLG